MEGSYCLPMFALLGSSAVTGAMSFMNKRNMSDFQNTLNQAQLAIWDQIKQERTRIFVIASIAGLVIGIALRSNICLAVSGAIFTQMMVYKLWPKSMYIMDFVESPDQGNAYRRMSHSMTMFGDIGTIVGVLGYVILTNKINI